MSKASIRSQDLLKQIHDNNPNLKRRKVDQDDVSDGDEKATGREAEKEKGKEKEKMKEKEKEKGGWKEKEAETEKERKKKMRNVFDEEERKEKGQQINEGNLNGVEENENEEREIRRKARAPRPLGDNPTKQQLRSARQVLIRKDRSVERGKHEQIASEKRQALTDTYRLHPEWKPKQLRFISIIVFYLNFKKLYLQNI
jgi:hypothetical protein